MKDERRTMKRGICLQFIVHHSYFIAFSYLSSTFFLNAGGTTELSKTS